VGVDKLRKPFLVIALVLIAISMLICLGSNLVSQPPSFAERVNKALDSAQSNPKIARELEERDINLEDARADLEQTNSDDPPGLAIPALALINGILLLVLIMTALPMLIGDRVTGTVQGVVGIIGGLLTLLAAIVVVIIAFSALMLMVGLFLAVPFGTMAYLAIFGSFDTGASAAITFVLMVLQILAFICVILAQERFLKIKGLVVLFFVTIGLTFVTSLLHSIVPGILVSITDAIGAIINGIIAAIWAIFLLIGGIIGVIRLLGVAGGAGRMGLTRTAGPAAQPTQWQR
jgi:hypothetical protein